MSKKIDRRINGEDIVEKEFGDFLENGAVLGGGGLIKGFLNGIILGKEGVEESKIQTLHYGDYNAFAPTHSRAVDLGLNTNAWKDIWVGSASKNRDGYTKLPNGMILQWGSIIGTSTTTGTVNYPIAFPNSVFQVMGTINRGDGVTHTCNVNSTMANSKSFVWYSDKAINSGIALMWIAIGH